MDAHSQPYLDGARSRISTLTFSTPFTIASAIIARQFGPAQLKRSWIENPQVWELAARVRSRHDAGLSIEALTADIPIGAALRRTRRWQAAAFGWSIAATAFGRFGRWRRPETFRMMAGLSRVADESRPLDLKNSTKPMGARVEICLKDGRVLSHSVLIPRGFAGAPTSEAGGHSTRELMREKYVNAAGRVIGAHAAVESADLIEQLESLSPSDLARLIDLACLAVPR
jgi:2-methylcitrate dehydratase PrpD